MRPRAEGPPMAVAAGINRTIRIGIRPDGEELETVRQEAARDLPIGIIPVLPIEVTRVLRAEAVRVLRPTEIIRIPLTGAIRVPAVGANRVPAAEEIPDRREAIRVHRRGAIRIPPPTRGTPGLPPTGVTRVLRAGVTPVLPVVVGLRVVIPAKSVLPAGSSPAAAAGRAMPAILRAAGAEVQVKDKL
jgi:hypothetical protein